MAFPSNNVAAAAADTAHSNFTDLNLVLTRGEERRVLEGRAVLFFSEVSNYAPNRAYPISGYKRTNHFG